MSIDIQWLSSNFPDLENVQTLATGGQKWVFAADHQQDGPVVLKLIKPTHDVEIVSREMLAVQQVQSDRVPRIIEHGQIQTQLGDCYWFREQRILGDSLKDVLSNGSLDPTAVLRLGLHILEALVQAEVANIVHRDVKPGNIIQDPNGDFWLLDFGIARHLQLTSLTPTAAHFGKFTVGYAPPEQFRNIKRDIDARADLFALGVTLYECATGANPFLRNARTLLEVLSRVETAVLPPITLNIREAGEFRDLLSCMTQKRRVHRPRTVAEALAWMQQICAAEGI
jgi:serine/threonine-protein kinase